MLSCHGVKKFRIVTEVDRREKILYTYSKVLEDTNAGIDEIMKQKRNQVKSDTQIKHFCKITRPCSVT